MEDVVSRYLGALQAKDWDGLASTLADTGFERVGPFCDTVDSKAQYVKFLDAVVSPFEQYRIYVRRLSRCQGAVYAEINESFEADGTAMDFPEVLVFDIDPQERIRRVQVYMMRPRDAPPVAGARAEVSRKL